MTSIHFVVHPLPGTEDQLNDRYFVTARGKEEFISIFMCELWYIGVMLYLSTMLTLSCVWIRVLII